MGLSRNIGVGVFRGGCFSPDQVGDEAAGAADSVPNLEFNVRSAGLPTEPFALVRCLEEEGEEVEGVEVDVEGEEGEGDREGEERRCGGSSNTKAGTPFIIGTMEGESPVLLARDGRDEAWSRWLPTFLPRAAGDALRL
jgi:hypothetical protein